MSDITLFQLYSMKQNFFEDCGRAVIKFEVAWSFRYVMPDLQLFRQELKPMKTAASTSLNLLNQKPNTQLVIRVILHIEVFQLSWWKAESPVKLFFLESYNQSASTKRGYCSLKPDWVPQTPCRFVSCDKNECRSCCSCWENMSQQFWPGHFVVILKAEGTRIIILCFIA